MKNLFFFATLVCLLPWNMEAQEPFALKGDALFGAISARHIGPALMSGRVTDLEGHPSEPKILYVGTAGGGVWKSTDGGITYNSIFDKYCQSIGALAVDPSDPENTIWVGTGEIWTRNSTSVGDGLYRSQDGGKSFKKIGFEHSERISSIQINPQNSLEIYVGVLGPLWGDSKDRGIYKTVDGGQNWEKIFYINEGTGCNDLLMDPVNPNILYAGLWEFRRTAWSFNSGGENSALYKTVDGGKNWKKIHQGFPSGNLGRIGIAIAPSSPNILYSVIETEQKENNGLYKSLDAGKTWEHKNKDFELAVRPFYFSRLVVHPTNPAKLAKAGLRGGISTDGGKTFRSIPGSVHADIHDFWFDVKNEDKITLGCDGGVYRSYDGGYVWEMVKGLPLSQFYHITVDNEVPFNVYGGLQDNGSWVGPSSSPGGVEAGDWKRVGAGDGFRVYPVPNDPNTCYSEMQGAEGVWRVNIEKEITKTVKPYAEEGDPKLRFNWNAPISTSQHDPNVLFIGSQFLHRSNDKGDTWEKISGDLTTDDESKQNQTESGGLSVDNSGAENHCTIFTIGESPLDKAVIWIGTDDGNVQVTFDGGQSWENVTKNLSGVPANTWVYHIEPSSFDVKTAYAVFDGHTRNDPNPYVLKTKDGGKSWESITTQEIVGFARSIQEDYENPDLLYLGTEFGLYITVDGGKSWNKFTKNMPSVAVHHVTLHPRDHALVLGTHGRGVIIIDDVRSLREAKPELLTETVRFLDMGPQIISEKSGWGGTSNFGEYVGGNPSRSAQVVYYQNKRHIFGKMKIEVFDSKGRKVADLAGGKQKGFNQVNWNYRYNPPKIAKAKTITFGGFNTPLMAPGKYKVVMTKGKETYESVIELQHDPESIHSLEERMAGHEAVMKLYDMNEELAFMINQVNAIEDRTGLLKALDNKKISMASSELNALVGSFKKALVVLEGDNYVGQAEPQLREKIASLYGDVASYSGKPSNAQLKNMELLYSKLAESYEGLNKILKATYELNVLLEKAGLEKTELQTKEAFLGKKVRS